MLFTTCCHHYVCERVIKCYSEACSNINIWFCSVCKLSIFNSWIFNLPSGKNALQSSNCRSFGSFGRLFCLALLARLARLVGFGRPGRRSSPTPAFPNITVSTIWDAGLKTCSTATSLILQINSAATSVPGFPGWLWRCRPFWYSPLRSMTVAGQAFCLSLRILHLRK